MVSPVTAANPVSLDTFQELTSGSTARTGHHPIDRPTPAAQVHEKSDTTVTISTVSQILAMKQNGATPDQIAARLHLSVAEVEAQLGTTAKQTPAQMAILAALSAKN